MFNRYNLSEPHNGIYEFTTDQNVVYSVYFSDGHSYFYDYPEFCADVLTFGFDRQHRHHKTTYDYKIKTTITHLIYSYLEARQDKVLFFVCDSADSRGNARMRMFHRWYTHLTCDMVEKHDESIVTDDMSIHCSILLHKNNPMKAFIRSSFSSLSYTTAEKLKSY
nr:DUF6169 family protein [uncultured Chitinophaga sp.]